MQKTLASLTISLLFTLALPSVAQTGTTQTAPAGTTAARELPRARISLNRIAPGKHLEFLRWLAAQDAVSREIGAPVPMCYAHTDGDAWDYLCIETVTEPGQRRAMQDRFDAAARRKGMKTGFQSSLEFRQFVVWHTDTFVIGPLTADDLVREGTKP